MVRLRRRESKPIQWQASRSALRLRASLAGLALLVGLRLLRSPPRAVLTAPPLVDNGVPSTVELQHHGVPLTVANVLDDVLRRVG
eukprot:10809532-Alexandrium_andersonii.AAC.1